MSIRESLEWQWRGYSTYHAGRANLLLHIVVVPLFLAGNVGLVAALVIHLWSVATACLGTMLVSVALQGRGHKTEAVPPEPFTGAGNAIARILLEQWISFPRFVVSGKWRQALRNAAP